MARVLLSGLVSDIRGKLNGSVFKQSNAGLLLQNKVASRKSAGQRLGNALLTIAGATNSATLANNTVKNAWNDFTDAERDTWNAYAVSIQKGQKNNNALFLNGLQLFLKINTIRLMSGLALIVAPTYGVSNPVPLTIETVVVTAALDIEFSRKVEVDEVFYFRISAPVRSTVNTAGSRTRLMRVQPVVATSTIDIAAEYVAEFGVLPAVGVNVFTMVSAQSDLSGIETTPRIDKILTT